MVALCGPACAQPVSGPYLSLGAGAGLLQDEIVKANPALREPKRTAVFDPGFAGSLAAGYGLGNGLRLEIEGNFADNRLDHVNFPNAVHRAGGNQLLYGGMVDAIYDFDLGLPVYPYLGVGVGGELITQEHFNSSLPSVSLPVRAGRQTRGGFAYQAIAGVAVPVSQLRGLSVTVDYHLIGMPDIPAFGFTSYTSRGELIGRGHAKYSNLLNHEVMIGLRYAFDTAPPPPAPVPVVAPAPAVAQTRSYLVFFDWDGANLSPRARQIVAEAAQASAHVQITRIEVRGYTDNSSARGGAAGLRYNMALSIRRAEHVRSELVHDGVAISAIDIHGYGETSPLVATGPNTREPQNRRVEILLR